MLQCVRIKELIPRKEAVPPVIPPGLAVLVPLGIRSRVLPLPMHGAPVGVLVIDGPATSASTYLPLQLGLGVFELAQTELPSDQEPAGWAALSLAIAAACFSSLFK